MRVDGILRHQDHGGDTTGASAMETILTGQTKMKILLLAAILIAATSTTQASNQKIRGQSIQNVSKGAMPVAKMQQVGGTGRKIYTARAKTGYCFAVKNGKILYMSTQRATKLEAQTYAWAHHAQSASRTPQPQPKKR